MRNRRGPLIALLTLAGAKVNRDLANQVAAALEDAGLPERLSRARSIS